MKAALLVFAACVIAVQADFPQMNYYIQSLFGCPGEKGHTTKHKDKCNQFLQVQGNEYVRLSKTEPTAFLLHPTGKTNEYRIIHNGKYLSYHTKHSNWAVVDKSDKEITWEILPRAGGFLLRTKYNCPSWPCNQELTTGNGGEEYLWVENGYTHAFRIFPSE